MSDARKEEEREKTSAEITWWGLGTQGSFGVGMMPKNDIKRRVPKSPPRHTLLPFGSRVHLLWVVLFKLNFIA